MKTFTELRATVEGTYNIEIADCKEGLFLSRHDKEVIQVKGYWTTEGRYAYGWKVEDGTPIYSSIFQVKGIYQE